MTPLQVGLLFVLLLTLALLYLLWRGARRARTLSGLPEGRIVYADAEGWQRGEVLYAPRYDLSGKPDYVMQGGRERIPIELKPGRRASQPYDSDVLQLAAYCLLLEETTGRRPPYGLLRYGGETFEIPYTQALRRSLLRILDDMRHDLRARDVPRSHDEPVRCRFCGHRGVCHQRLVD